MVVHKIIRGFLGVVGVVVVAFTMLSVVAVWSGYRFNPSSSAPVGIWKISARDPQRFSVGEYVFICPPIHDVVSDLVKDGHLFRGRCESGTVPFIKEVIARGEGSFRVGDDGVYIDGELIPETAPYPWHNLHPAAATDIKSDEFIAIQTMHAGSIDSRYFGPLLAADVIGVIEPVWIF